MAKRAYTDNELKILLNYKNQTLFICLIEAVLFALLKFVLKTNLFSTFELVCLAIIIPVAFYVIRCRLTFGVDDSELVTTLVAGILCSVSMGRANGLSLITVIVLVPMWAIIIVTAYAYRTRKG